MKQETNPKTKKIGKGTINITVNAPIELHTAICQLAAESDMKMGEYIRRLLTRAANNRTKYKVVQEGGWKKAK